MVDSRLDIWGSVSSHANLVPGRSEASMRDELIDTLDGKAREIAKGGQGLYRKARLDDDGNRIACSCIDQMTNEVQTDPPCPYCFGDRWLWDETWFDYYRVISGIESSLAMRDDIIQPGRVNIPRVVFYTKYDVEPVIIDGQTSDRIIEVARDLEGNVITPYVRQRTYRIGTPIDFRCDNNRLEYWKFVCYPDDMPSTGQAGVR